MITWGDLRMILDQVSEIGGWGVLEIDHKARLVKGLVVTLGGGWRRIVEQVHTLQHVQSSIQDLVSYSQTLSHFLARGGKGTLWSTGIRHFVLAMGAEICGY